MARKQIFAALFTLAALATLAIADGRDAPAADLRHVSHGHDLFYNYYQAPYRCGGVPARMYVSPIPTPPRIGHTNITYQPLMPHEFLYRHHRTYHRYHGPHGGHTRTHVTWR